VHEQCSEILRKERQPFKARADYIMFVSEKGLTSSFGKCDVKFERAGNRALSEYTLECIQQRAREGSSSRVFLFFERDAVQAIRFAFRENRTTRCVGLHLPQIAGNFHRNFRPKRVSTIRRLSDSSSSAASTEAILQFFDRQFFSSSSEIRIAFSKIYWDFLVPFEIVLLET